MSDAKDELPVVAWRYMPSNVWGEYVITTDPERVSLAKEFGREVEPLTSHAAAQSRINALLEEVEGLRKDAQRLDWLHANPNLVKWGHGYLGSPGGWSWRDANHNHHDAEDLRAAIDASLSSGRSGSGEG